MQKYDIGILGAGVAGAFAATRLAQHGTTKVVVFELGRPPAKRRRQLEGWLGCLPAGDGKLYTDIEKISNIVDGRKTRYLEKWVLDLFSETGKLKLKKDILPTNSLQKKLNSNDFKLKLNPYFQIYSENIHDLSKILAKQTEEKITFNFDDEVFEVSKIKNGFVIKSQSGETFCSKLILSVGRSGWRWVNNLYADFDICKNDNYATYGIKVELPETSLKDFNKSHCTLYKDNLTIGPLSWGGTVIPEDHADLVVSSFKSNEDRFKTNKVSFSLLSKQEFKEEGCYQADRLGKITFLLSNDRINKEKIKTILNKSSSISILKEYDWLTESINKLQSIMPDIISKGSFYIPDIFTRCSEVKLNSNLESEIEGLYIAGESANFDGIFQAALSGAICADNFK